LHYVASDKINTSIHIRIQQILKVKILIQRMHILTRFITSLKQIDEWTCSLWTLLHLRAHSTYKHVHMLSHDCAFKRSI